MKSDAKVPRPPTKKDEGEGLGIGGQKQASGGDGIGRPNNDGISPDSTETIVTNNPGGITKLDGWKEGGFGRIDPDTGPDGINKV